MTMNLFRSLSSESSELEQPPKATTPLVGFDTFWDAYPNKVARKVAMKSWEKLAPDEALALQIVTAVHDNRAYNKQWASGFVPMPATWLNQERWHDDIPGKPRLGSRKGPSSASSPYPGGKSRHDYENQDAWTLEQLLADASQSPSKYRRFMKQMGKRMSVEYPALYEGMTKALAPVRELVDDNRE